MATFDIINTITPGSLQRSHPRILRITHQHTRRFARMFAGDPHIRVPAVFDDHTRQRVLTLSRHKHAFKRLAPAPAEP